MCGRNVLKCAFNRVFFYEPLIANKLLDFAGGLEAVFAMSAKDIDFAAPEGHYGSRLHSLENMERASVDAEWYEAHKVAIVERESPDYPFLLKECVDSPPVFFYRGDFSLSELAQPLKRHSLAIIGTRVCTRYGEESCREIVRAMADGGYNPLIVSGLARGIDGIAHCAALDNGLNTIAVLPCGLDNIYPSDHRDLAINIVGSGGVLTEFPRGTNPLRTHFLQRNRIIAGLSEGVLVVESRLRGGCMNTSSHALSYQRDVFALPGRISDPASCGCNSLIDRNMAALCYNAATITKGLGWEIKCDTQYEKILLHLSLTSFRSIDKIVKLTKMPLEDVTLALLELQVKGKVRQNGRDEYALCKEEKCI